ncbi:MAG: substrate-binding domain-containing protein [Paramuribaculum sp.]|nr:phosphate ABC transporter substrate-binding protein [Bacteroides sp.]MBD5375465.1 phosphate ABC transporter substrate-binding protein [Bacteroides sp.]MDE7460909.1 substrate-binding domain-containing protein [Paramuribaculum sp.]
MTQRSILSLAAGAIVLAGVALCSCDKKVESTSTSGIATLVCDASFENIMAQEIDVFEYIYPNASIMPLYTDQNAAIDSLLDFKTKTIVVTRALTQKEVDYLKSNKKQVRQSQIAVDALALIVNPANNVEILSKPEIAEILSGKITEWNQVVPGNNHLGKIEVVFDHQGSSTVQYMRDSLLAGGEFGPNVYAQKSPQAVFDAVAANKNAVGIIGVSWISRDLSTRELSREDFAKAVERNDTTDISFDNQVKVLKVRGNNEVTAYQPYQYYIYNGSYPLYRQIYMITTAPGGSIGHGFYTFVTGFQGQKIMLTTGVLPKVVQPTMVQIN